MECQKEIDENDKAEAVRIEAEVLEAEMINNAIMEADRAEARRSEAQMMRDEEERFPLEHYNPLFAEKSEEKPENKNEEEPAKPNLIPRYEPKSSKGMINWDY